MKQLKQPAVYYTPYPRPHWCWFDIAVYRYYTPKIGNLPSDVFAKLKGGTTYNKACRQYQSEVEAIADYEQAMGAINE